MKNHNQTKKATTLPDGFIMSLKEKRALEDAMSCIPAGQEKALKMRIWEGASIDRIASHLCVDWERAQALVEEGLENVEQNFLDRKMDVENYPFLFEALEMAA